MKKETRLRWNDREWQMIFDSLVGDAPANFHFSKITLDQIDAAQKPFRAERRRPRNKINVTGVRNKMASMCGFQPASDKTADKPPVPRKPVASKPVAASKLRKEVAKIPDTQVPRVLRKMRVAETKVNKPDATPVRAVPLPPVVAEVPVPKPKPVAPAVVTAPEPVSVSVSVPVVNEWEVAFRPITEFLLARINVPITPVVERVVPAAVSEDNLAARLLERMQPMLQTLITDVVQTQLAKLPVVAPHTEVSGTETETLITDTAADAVDPEHEPGDVNGNLIVPTVVGDTSTPVIEPAAPPAPTKVRPKIAVVGGMIHTHYAVEKMFPQLDFVFLSELGANAKLRLKGCAYGLALTEKCSHTLARVCRDAVGRPNFKLVSGGATALKHHIGVLLSTGRIPLTAKAT